MPALPCLLPFSLSVVDHYADENENAKSCLVSLGPGQSFLGIFRAACLLAAYRVFANAKTYRDLRRETPPEIILN